MDAGAHPDSLVHDSQLSDPFVKNPANVVKAHQKVAVTQVDLPRKRIDPCMRSRPNLTAAPRGGAPKSAPPRESGLGPADRRKVRARFASHLPFLRTAP